MSYRFLPLLVSLWIVDACTFANIAFKYADWIILHKIDAFFDIDAKQKGFLDLRVKQHLAWARREKLPEVRAFLVKFIPLWLDGLTRDELKWLQAAAEDLRREIVNRLAADAALFLTSLSPQQIDHFSEELEKTNSRMVKLLNLSDSELKSRQQEKILEQYEFWFGKLSDGQKQEISEMFATNRQSTEKRLQERRQTQTSLVQTLRVGNKDKIEKWLRQWGSSPEQLLERRQTVQVRARRQKNHEAFLTLDPSWTKKQRQAVVDKVMGFIEAME